MRYANHRSGKKYVGPVPADRKGRSGAHGRKVARPARDEQKLKSARIFKRLLDTILKDSEYLSALEEHRRRYESAQP